MFSSPHKIIRKPFPKIQGREDFRVIGCIFHLLFQKFFICLRMKLISILIASGLLLQINLVSRYDHPIITFENNKQYLLLILVGTRTPSGCTMTSCPTTTSLLDPCPTSPRFDFDFHMFLAPTGAQCVT